MTDHPVEKFDFIINRRAGAVLNAGEETVRDEILAKFGDKAGTFTFMEGKDVAAAVKFWAETHAGQNRGLVIGGGDGTVITAAEQVLGRKDITLGILPLGTQNLIARQLGFSADFRVAAAQYKSGHSIEMDVGKVNGMHFLVGIAIDKNVVNFYEAREDMRDKKYLSAFRKAFAAAAGYLIGFKNEFAISKQENWQGNEIFRGRGVSVTNNKLQPRSLKGVAREGGWRKNMVANIMAKGGSDKGELALYVLDGGLIKSATLPPKVVQGTWTGHKSVKVESSAQFFIQEVGVKKAQERSFILDGEIKKTRYPLNIGIIPKGLRIFKPE